MRNIWQRAGRIIRSQIFDPKEALARRMEATLQRLEARAARRSEGGSNKNANKERKKDYGKQSDDTGGSEHFGSGTNSGAGYDPPPKTDPVAEDLAIFGLVPPSSLAEVKRLRNREIKKYHPDHFQNDPSRRETAKEIMQIYNAAYDRLRRHYEG